MHNHEHKSSWGQWYGYRPQMFKRAGIWVTPLQTRQLHNRGKLESHPVRISDAVFALSAQQKLNETFVFNSNFNVS